MVINQIDFQIMGDNRGSLIALEESKNIPFDIKRVYYMYGMQGDTRRGFHAHKNLKQIAVCVSGSCKILFNNGAEKSIIELNSPSKGIIIESMIWREMYDFSENCVLIVLANELYDEDDYIRNYDEFIKRVSK